MPLPSVFFIGDNGTVLEIIIDSSLSPDDLFAKINTILVKSGRLSVSAASANLLTAEVAASVSAQESNEATSSGAGVATALNTSSTNSSAVNDEEQARQNAAVLQKAKDAIERVRKEKEAETARVRILQFSDFVCFTKLHDFSWKRRGNYNDDELVRI